MTELLSPAGNMACLDSALAAGADAVYLAGASFGARAYAGNFNNDELLIASEKAHFLGKKLYITLNTLVTDRETDDALNFARFLYENGVCDGIIIQDLGLAKEIKNTFPALTLHGSTQMCVHSAAGVLKATEIGLERVVIAREATREEIKKCVSTGIEIEAFIHGAYCVSQSGGCLMSSFIGKRSGNRGCCAQPCRLPYEGGYHLSLKDMCLAEHIPSLVADGVASLKIEGRMKSPEYVYAVTSTYRDLLDQNRGATGDEMRALAGVFSRSGFSDGYYTGKKGAFMFGIRKESDKTRSRGVEISIPPLPPKNADIFGYFGKEQTFVTAVCGDNSFTVTGTSLPATGKGTTAEELTARLKKSGGSGFKTDTVCVEAADGVFMPASAVNALRRDALNGLKAEILKANAPVKSEKKFEIKKENHPFLPVKGDIYRLYSPEYGFKVPEDAARIDIPIWLWKTCAEKYDTEKISLFLPRVITGTEETEIKEILKNARNTGIKRVTVTNIGHIALCEGFAVYGDGNLNVTNTRTALLYEEMGFSGVCVSPEVTPRAVKTEIGEYPVYGRQVLMHTENCIIKNICGGCAKNCRANLVDRTGAAFPVQAEYNHRNLIFNSVPTYLLDKDISHNRLFVITDEKVLDKPKEFTRGYRK